MQFRHGLGVPLILIAVVLPAFGQMRPTPTKSTHSIEGTVRDDYDQHAMESIRVDLKQATGTPINTTFTNGNGEFEFAGLPNGGYTVGITVRDYEPIQETVSIQGSDRRGLSIFLRRPMNVVSAKSGVTVSAHELSVPHKAYDEYEKGLRLSFSKSDYKGAIDQFQRAIKDFPNFYEAYAQEGNAYAFLGEVSQAEEAMQKSIAISSNQYPDAFFLLAGLLNNQRRFPEAEPLARQGVALEASSWHGHFEMARALTALKRPEEAEKSATQARDLMPDNPAVYLVLANIHIQLRDHASLLKDLDAYLKLSPTGPEADQARKTRDDLQAMRNGHDPSQTNEANQAKSSVSAQPQPHPADQPMADKHDRAQPAEDDPPLLPPLPPPQPEP